MPRNLVRHFLHLASPARLWRYFQHERPREHARLSPFRLRFTPFALSQAALGLPWAGAAFVAPSSAKAALLIFSAFKVIGGGALSGALIHFFFPIRANERELRGRAFIGWARRASWDEVTSVRHRQWLFAPYLLLSTSTRRNAIWLPLFLCEQRDFEANIEKWLAPQHPLRVFLREHRAQKPPPSEVTPSCPTS